MKLSGLDVKISAFNGRETNPIIKDKKMNIEFLLEDIKAKEIEIENLGEYISKTKKEIAEYRCPFVVGERVVSGQGEDHAIASIGFVGYGVGYEFKIHKVKKNGEPYKDSCYAYWQGKYTKKL